MYYIQNFHLLCNAPKLHFIPMNSEKNHRSVSSENKFGKKNACLSCFWADKWAIGRK